MPKQLTSPPKGYAAWAPGSVDVVIADAILRSTMDSMNEAPKPRWFRSVVWPNALIIFVAGPAIALLLYGLGWVVDRPHPKDVVFLLVRFVAVGLIVGTSASICYLAFSGAKRFRFEWFRFRLRTLFVLLTVAGILAGWAMAQWSWIRERHEFEAEQSAILTEATGSSSWGKNFSNRFITRDNPSLTASVTLRIFGENASDHPSFFFWGELRPADLDRVERLYPEASRILCVTMPESTHTNP